MLKFSAQIKVTRSRGTGVNRALPSLLHGAIGSFEITLTVPLKEKMNKYLQSIHFQPMVNFNLHKVLVNSLFM